MVLICYANVIILYELFGIIISFKIMIVIFIPRALGHSFLYLFDIVLCAKSGLNISIYVS